MYKRITTFLFIALASSLVAAPTANEDYVDRQDATTYTNAVTDAATYTDAATNGAVTAARSLANAAKTGAVAQANAYTDAATNGAVAAANAYTDAAVADAKPSDYDTVKATAESAVQPADLEPYCTIEAARRMTNGLTKVTSTDVAGWGFLTGDWTGKTITAGNGTVINLGTGTTVRGTDDTTIQLGGGSLSIPANMTIGILGSRTLANYGIGNAYTKAEVDSLVANATPSDYNSVKSSVAVIANYIGGEDARAVVTNYNEGASDIPHLYFEYKNDQGEWVRIWDEMTRWLRFMVPYEQFTNGMNAAIARLDREKAPIEYGFYDTHTGRIAPDGFFSISSERIIIANNMAYQKTVTTSGEAWILEANEPMIVDGVTSNGFFKITDGDGNALFEIVKGDKRTVPATCRGVTTTEIMGITHLHVNYNVVADVHPSIAICTDLKTHDWKAEDAADCPANVSWTGSSGAWVAEIWGKSPEDKMFVKGEYEVGGETYIKNTAPIGFTQVVIGGITYNVAVETVSGKKLMVLTEAQ